MITYRTIPATDRESIAVYLDGKRVGTIVEGALSGYFYQPINSNRCGDIMPTVEDVKRSLE